MTAVIVVEKRRGGLQRERAVVTRVLDEPPDVEGLRKAAHEVMNTALGTMVDG